MRNKLGAMYLPNQTTFQGVRIFWGHLVVTFLKDSSNFGINYENTINTPTKQKTKFWESLKVNHIEFCNLKTRPTVFYIWVKSKNFLMFYPH